LIDAPAVRMTGITKRYPRVVANRNVSFEVRPGEVHAVVGENGAGKSTLMKILYGLVPADEGTIEVRGRRLERYGPSDAIAAGVGMVFQHFMLLPPLTVAENIVLGMEPVKGGVFFDRDTARAKIREVSKQYGLEVDPDARVEECPVGLQQRVEILKVLLRGAEVIILDEPTAVLTPQEVDELIAVIRRLAGQGKTILIITHKMREVMAASDRVTVMRAGEVVGTLETKATSAGEIAHLMVGREVESPKRQPAQPAGSAVLAVKSVCATSDRGTTALSDVSFDVRAGEIVGIAGVEGNGQSELIQCLVGLRRPTAGSVVLAGRTVTRWSPRARFDAGLAHIAEDRHKRAVVLDFTLEENAILGRQWRFAWPGWLHVGPVRREIDGIIATCDVRPPDRGLLMRSLSGGNQQKVVVGRELARRPALLIAAHPTRGLDIGAIEFVQKALLAERARGTGVLLISAELSELMAISDRILVIAGGRIVGQVDPAQVDERQLGLMMTGAH